MDMQLEQAIQKAFKSSITKDAGFYVNPTQTYKKLRNDLIQTPVRRLHWLERYVGVPVWAKMEFQQHSGSFKYRGALNKLLDYPKNQVVAAASAGNHGLAVAMVGQKLGLTVNICVPTTASRIKRERILATGAGVIDYGTSVDDSIDYCQQLCQERNWTFVSPFNDAEVVRGNSTVAVELSEALGELNSVIVPVGGGGLISGIALGLQWMGSNARVFGCEPERYDSMSQSLSAGECVRVLRQPTFADGLALSLEPQSITLPIVQSHVERVLTLTEEELAAGTLALLVHESILVEPAGAAPVVALMKLAQEVKFDGPIALVLSGGNMSHSTLARIQRFPFRDPELLRLAELRGRSVVDLPVQRVHNLTDKTADRQVDGGPRMAWKEQLQRAIARLDRAEADIRNYKSYCEQNDLMLNEAMLQELRGTLDIARRYAQQISDTLPGRTDEDSLAEAESVLRWVLQTAAYVRGTLEWNSSSYTQSRVPQFFDLGCQDSPTVNYERYESNDVQQIESQLTEVLALPSDHLSLTVTSSGMAAYTLIELFLLRHRLQPGDVVLLAPYIYFEALEQLELIPSIKVVRAGGYSAEDMMAAVREYRPKVVFVDPLANIVEQRTADLLGFLEQLRGESRGEDDKITVVIDGTMVSAAMPAEEIIEKDGVEVIYYESCSKYQQLGLDANMAGLVVHPVTLRGRFDRLRRNSGTILYRHGARLFPHTDRQFFLQRMNRISANARYITDRVLNDPGAMEKVSVYYPGHTSHPDYQVASRLPYCGGCVTFDLADPGANHRDQLDALIDDIMDRARAAGVHLTKGVSFGFSVPRISAASAMAELTAPFLRLSVGDREPDQVAKLADILIAAVVDFGNYN